MPVEDGKDMIAKRIPLVLIGSVLSFAPYVSTFTNLCLYLLDNDPTSSFTICVDNYTLVNGMKKRKNLSNNFMTVGELAKKAGVTVRTLQYYDQKEILSPSVKGTRNQRLYTEEDEDRLYQILCYKYMGLALHEIKELLDTEDSEKSLPETLDKQIFKQENAFLDQIKRYAALRNVSMFLKEKNSDIDWKFYLDYMNFVEKKWSIIWEINQAFSEHRNIGDYTGLKLKELNQYHHLMNMMLQQMQQGVSPEDDSVAAILDEYFHTINDRYSSLESMAPVNIQRITDVYENRDFEESLSSWSKLEAYIEQAVKHYLSANKFRSAQSE